MVNELVFMILVIVVLLMLFINLLEMMVIFVGLFCLCFVSVIVRLLNSFFMFDFVRKVLNKINRKIKVIEVLIVEE